VVAIISFPTVRKLPRPEGGREEEEEGEEAEAAREGEEEEDMMRMRTASRGQVSRQVMMVESAEAPRMMGISKTSAEPGPMRSVRARRKNSLKPEEGEGARERGSEGQM
jgi:hypothetical protein